MRINGVEIVDTFAEAFPMWGARVLVTAVDRSWAREAALAATGFATSVIACGCEAGIESETDDTPDGRPGVNILFFAVSRQALEDQLLRRIGQCVMTAPTTACFNNLEAAQHIRVGGKLRYFGDGYQASKLLGHRRFWRVPVMEGEFLLEDSFGVQKAVGGGNLLILAETQEAALQAAEKAVAAMRAVRGIVMPFPGGIVRSGSKVGSRYRFLNASTSTAYCPTLRARVASQLPPGVNAVLEIVVDGLELEAVREAMRVGLRAACLPGVISVSAGNYGGSLGPYHIHLRELVG
ncbi:formylmethanofuran--tetrahydromethanopterin formyltransferase [Clostridiales bacterium PH28_bin88]|nr:formylmethanofuran--tetrahydromethanopterin formyltransferase [Clostridiales bacterium PH28_bin88]